MSAEDTDTEYDFSQDPTIAAGMAQEAEEEVDIFEQFSRSVSVDVGLKEFILPIPLRQEERIGIIVDPKFEFDDLMRWSKASVDKKKSKKNQEVRPRIMANIVLSNVVKGVSIGGKEVLTPQGERMSLTNKMLWQIIAADKPNSVYDVASCISVLFAGVSGSRAADGYVVGAMNEVIDRAGYGDVGYSDDDDYEGAEDNSPLD